MKKHLALASVLLAIASPALAHHGGGSFDLSKSVTYEGVLIKVELVNPHSWLYFDVNTIRFKDGTHMDRYGQHVKGDGGTLTEVRGPVSTPNALNRPLRLPSGVLNGRVRNSDQLHVVERFHAGSEDDEADAHVRSGRLGVSERYI